MNEKIDISVVELDDASYLSAYCPNPNMPIWSSHPKIFLDFDDTGEARCPYCSTVYRLRPGVKAKGHH